MCLTYGPLRGSFLDPFWELLEGHFGTFLDIHFFDLSGGFLTSPEALLSPKLPLALSPGALFAYKLSQALPLKLSPSALLAHKLPQALSLDLF